jgi:hypothetical protein
VLDVGEDCDTPDQPRCVQCAWTCTADSDCADIPAPRVGANYRCGVDHVCHAPGGALAAETGEPLFAAERFYVTDVDGDGYGDAVGIGVDSIVTLGGNAAGTLSTSRSIASAVAAGSVAVADVDGDGRLDALLPTRDGLVTYASPHHAVSPLPFALEAIVAVDPLALVPIDDTRVAVLLPDPSDPSSLVGSTVDLSTIPPTFHTIPLCDNFVPANFDPTFVDFYDTTASAGAPSVSLTFVATARTSGAPEFCSITIVEDATVSPVTFKYSFISPQMAPRVRAVLAQLDASTCPSLVDSSLGPAQITVYPGQRNADGGCVPIATPYTLPALPGALGDAVVGRARLDPPPASGPRGPDALVLPGGVYAVDATSYAEYYAADRPLTASASGDFDRDGNVDAIATGNDASIDVLYRTVAPDGFVRGRLATDNRPTMLTIGDFDGNGVSDISYVEQEPTGASLKVVFGTAAGLRPAVEMASFAGVTSDVRLALADSADPNGTIDGLAVLEQRTYGAKTTRVASGFHGSVDRALIPFFDPRGAGASSAFRALVGGRFVPGATAFDQLAFEVPDPSSSDPNTRMWRLAGGDPGAVIFPLPNFVTNTGAVDVDIAVGGTNGAIGDCGRAPAAFCAETSQLIAWPGATTDIAIAVDPQTARAMFIDPTTIPAFSFPPAGPSSLVALPGQSLAPYVPAQSSLTAMFAADLDGDGSNELVMSFGSGTTAPRGLLWCTVGASSLACSDLAADAGLPAGACWIAAPGRFSPPDQPAAQSVDLLAACGADVYRVYFDPRAQHLTSHVLAVLGLPSEIDSLGVGDVTGDALDDLLVLATDPDGLRRLHVFPQLGARDVR